MSAPLQSPPLLIHLLFLHSLLFVALFNFTNFPLLPLFTPRPSFLSLNHNHIKKASLDPLWVQAMESEIQALQANNTWTEVERASIDFTDTFSLVVKMSTIRTIIALAAQK